MTISIKMATSTGDRQVPVWAWIGLVLSCCFFSGITGDVPDGVVYTDLHKTVQLGDRVVLKCEFLGTPLAVYWKKGNDPTIKQSLMSWFGDEPLEGTCVKDKTCDMGDDFSLIIKNISIADQNRYICRVASYKGILIYNFTDVKVFALPEEPYPIINDCKERQGQNCILLATGPVNITCTVLKYFPNVDLFFLHGIKKYSTADTLEWTNTDGTKSKSIFTTAPPSEIPYGCVAFNIPGSQDQRTAVVTVTGQSDVATAPSSRLPRPSETDGPIERNKYFVIKIAVPIIAAFCVVIGIILFFTIHRRRQRRRKNKNDDEAMPMVPRKKIDGKISYYELWSLVRELYDHDNTALLRGTLGELRKAHIKEDLSEQEAYEMFCTWKDNNRSGNEGEILNKALIKVLKEDYDRARDIFCAIRKDLLMKIYQGTLEHILWSISDLKKVDKLLNELIPGRPTPAVNDSVKKMDAMQSALRELTEWSNGNGNGQLELNPLVSLSFALEAAGCRSVAMTFFLHCCGTMSHRPFAADLKEQLQSQHSLFDHETLYDDDIPQLVKLIKCLPLDKIAQLNSRTGFSGDRDDNILDQELKEKRHNILTRSTSRDASSKEFRSLRHELTKHTENFHSTVKDDEIEVVASQITAADKQKELLRCLGIAVGAKQDISFADMVDQLKEWQNTQANGRKRLQDSFRQIGFGECIVMKCTQRFVYQVELSSIALSLLMEDVRPLFETLGIDRRTVSSYIQPDSKQNKGTKRLVLKLLQKHGYSETSRNKFCKALQCIGFVDASRSVYFDYEPSLSELINILDCVGQDYMDRFLKHLDLGPDDIEEGRDSEGQINILKVMRAWKRQIRPVPYHYRLEIATALRAAGLNEIAEGVLSGEYRRKGLNADVLQSICSRLGDEGLTKLCTLLKLGPESTSRSLEASTTLVTEWANEWMSRYDPSDTGVMLGHMKDRKDMNDRLYSNGFCELAAEISALENCQQLIQ